MKYSGREVRWQLWPAAYQVDFELLELVSCPKGMSSEDCLSVNLYLGRVLMAVSITPPLLLISVSESHLS